MNDRASETDGTFKLNSSMDSLERVELVDASEWNRRFLVTLADGARVEAVRYRGDTLCISSQVGCAVSCPFCASGAKGLSRPLSLQELKAQIALVEHHDATTMARVTVSGVGEPLHNVRAVSELVSWCHERRTPASLTTSGGPVDRLAEWIVALPHNGLTISVHAGTEAVRAKLVPRGPSLASLFATLTDTSARLGRNRRRKTALAYLLVEDENDHDAELDAFAERASPLALTVHLYAHNAVPTSTMRGPSRQRYEAAYHRLTGRGLKVRMSSQARLDANGGCGTLIALRRPRFGPNR